LVIMAIIKSSKVRELTEAELQSKLFEYQKELNTERGVLAAGGRASNPGKLKQLRKSVARVLTIVHERKLGIVRKAKGAKKKEETKKPVEAKKPEEKKQ